MESTADGNASSAASRDVREPAGGTGPLAGLVVLEAGTLIAGPFAGRLLADLGADVIKVEAPDRPDPLRQWGQHSHDGRKLWWPVQSRNKRLITLNLREPEGQELFRQLADRADVVIENFRPGTFERWGLDPETLRERNPRLVVTRVSGYGQTGPYSSRAGFAAVAEAMGGLRHLNGFPDETPPRTGLALGDSLAALFATIGTLAALRHRDVADDGDGDAGGRGQVVDVSLMESAFALLESVAPEYSLTGHVRGPSGTTLSGIAPSNVYRTSDDKWIAIAANSDALFRRLTTVMGVPELADDPRFCTHDARGERQRELDAMVGAWVAEHPAAAIDEALNAAGVVCGPVNTIADIFDDPHARAREMLVVHDDPELGPFEGPGTIPVFSRTPAQVRWSGRWEAGADNASVYEGLLGLDHDELASLRERGVI
jgi:crotonobetainyl-CoA:carnitine CoA-transferase CaiB-like acyl-CoA transferase